MPRLYDVILAGKMLSDLNQNCLDALVSMKREGKEDRREARGRGRERGGGREEEEGGERSVSEEKETHAYYHNHTHT